MSNEYTKMRGLGLLSPEWRDYELIDTGDFEKLERFGRYVVRRPEPQAIWRKSLSEQEWTKRADASFMREGKSEERGSWRLKPSMPDRWTVGYEYKQMRLKMRLALTSFKHVGIFPEQAENWNFIYDNITEQRSVGKSPQILNLFAYTGGATLAARTYGSEFTHGDTVYQDVMWSSDTLQSSVLQRARWLVSCSLW